MKVEVEELYKLRMMGIPISGPMYIYGCNMSVIHNIEKTESTLKKKCNAVAYQAICKSKAMNKSFTGHIRSEYNPVIVDYDPDIDYKGSEPKNEPVTQ